MNRGYENRYAIWLERVNEWARKHGISEAQAVHVLDDVAVCHDLLKWAESNDFIMDYVNAETRDA